MKISSTGGRIIETRTGLIHYQNTDNLIDEWENKTGINGRPEKDSDQVKFDLSAFPQPTVPAWHGPSRIVSFK